MERSVSQQGAYESDATEQMPEEAFRFAPVRRTEVSGARIELLERIGIGGMAEVFRAQSLGPGGFKKTLVIKRILPHLISDHAFVEMFIEEAKLAARIQHGNIVQVFELGRTVTGEPYIAMEYVPGADLRLLLRSAKKLKLRIPIWFSVHVAVEILNALICIHGLTDDDGKPLDVVHRDVTPANIYVSSTGDVKLGDFGIAKSRISPSITRVGQIKGKVPYMAPEQFRDRRLDHRADLFAIGAVLWECLTQRRLFHGANDLETMKQISSAPRTPPSELNDRVPMELDDVVLSTLDVDPDRRPSNARALQARLLTVLRRLEHRVSRVEVQRVAEILLGRSDVAPSDVVPSDVAPIAPPPAVLTAQSSARRSPPPVPPPSEPPPRLAIEVRPFFLRAEPDAIEGPFEWSVIRSVLENERSASLEDYWISADGEAWVPLGRFARWAGLDRFAVRSARPSGVERTLEEGSLIRLLAMLRARRLTGRLEISLAGTTNGLREIHVLDGRPTYVFSEEPEEQVPEILTRYGLVRPEAVPALLHDVLRSGTAIERVTSPHAAELIRLYWPLVMRERLAALSRRCAGFYAFRPTSDLWRLEAFARSTVSVLLEMVDRSKSDTDVGDALAPFLQRSFMPSDQWPILSLELGLSPEESRSAVRLARGEALASIVPAHDRTPMRRAIQVLALVMIESGLLLPRDELSIAHS